MVSTLQAFPRKLCVHVRVQTLPDLHIARCAICDVGNVKKYEKKVIGTRAELFLLGETKVIRRARKDHAAAVIVPVC